MNLLWKIWHPVVQYHLTGNLLLFKKSVAHPYPGIIPSRLLVIWGELILIPSYYKVIPRNQALKSCISSKARHCRQAETRSDVFYNISYYVQEENVPWELRNYCGMWLWDMWQIGSKSLCRNIRLIQVKYGILISLRDVDKIDGTSERILCSMKVTEGPRKCGESKKVFIMHHRCFRTSVKVW